MANGEANMEAVERIKAAKNRSLKLIQMDANGTLNEIAKGKRSDINESLEGNDTNITTKNMMQNNKQGFQVRQTMNGAGVNNVPSVILESFKKNPINEYDSLGMLGEQSDSSVLDIIDNGSKSRKRIAESEKPVVQTTSVGIDYPMIRTIVEDTVKKQMSAFTKKILNEGRGEMNELSTISIGKTFKFLGKNGDIFECAMKKIGNIYDKKKSVNE